MPQPKTAVVYAHEHRQQFLNDLIEFSTIPSISTNPDAKQDIQKAAEWVAGKLLALGMQNVKIYPTGGHPIVYAESLNAGDNAPTVLIYGHYDVQPAEPLDKWESAPFKPEVRGENIYARGISDMKGQVAATWNAVEAIVNTSTLSINVNL